MKSKIDFSTVFGKRVKSQLETEEVIWLTTVGSDNTPHPRPVWFIWDGTSCLIYSQPATFKINHLMNNSKVSLNFNTDFGGEEVTVMIGEAMLAPDSLSVTKNEAYLKKYSKGIKGLEMTPKGFEEDYSVAIRVTPTKLRGF